MCKQVIHDEAFMDVYVSRECFESTFGCKLANLYCCGKDDIALYDILLDLAYLLKTKLFKNSNL